MVLVPEQKKDLMGFIYVDKGYIKHLLVYMKED